MSTSTFDEKIRSTFGEFAIDKGLVRRLGGAGEDRHVPSYVMDWIVTRNVKPHQSTGAVEEAVQEFIAKHLPAKGEKERIRFKLSQGETLTLLDAISVTVRLGKDVRYFASIECLDERKALIDASLIAQHEGLLQGSTWGAVKICYDGSEEAGGIRIIDFKPMPELFLESPLVDRFHGIIPGWEIPPFETDQQANGLGLKADYFAEVCHAMRSAPQLSQGVRDIVHRDIKPQNVLRCDDVWKIADFGISKLMNNPVTGYTFQGAHTAPWAPPEQIEGATAHPSADVYAWGRVAVFLLTGKTAKNAGKELPQPWKDLLTRCTDVVPENRPDASAVQAQLAKIAC